MAVIVDCESRSNWQQKAILVHSEYMGIRQTFLVLLCLTSVLQVASWRGEPNGKIAIWDTIESPLRITSGYEKAISYASEWLTIKFSFSQQNHTHCDLHHELLFPTSSAEKAKSWWRGASKQWRARRYRLAKLCGLKRPQPSTLSKTLSRLDLHSPSPRCLKATRLRDVNIRDDQISLIFQNSIKC
jgi:hypothetical protein